MRGRRVAAGAAWGFLMGAIVGFSVFKLWADAEYLNDEYNTWGAALVGTPAGGLLGAGVGIVKAPPRWQEVHIREWIPPARDE